MAAAMQWVSRITVIALEMVLPGIAGDWLDKRWGTSFLALVGFGLGITLGMWHLLVISKASTRRDSKHRESGSAKDSDSTKGPQA
jgi:hypothetical protein